MRNRILHQKPESKRRPAHTIIAGLLVLAASISVPASATAGQHRSADAPQQRSSRDVKQRTRPGELVVRFRDGVSSDEKRESLEAVGATLDRALDSLGAAVAKIDPTDEERIRKELEGDPRIAYAEPNFVVHASEDPKVPDDPQLGLQWGMDNTGQYTSDGTGTPDADIDAPEAWAVTTGSPEVVVGIIDTGVDFSNPDLGGNQQVNPRMWINPGEDCPGCRIDGVDNDANGYIDDWHGWDFVNDDNNPFDDHGHGTHVAGILGATGDNAEGGAGITWNTRIVALKFLDAGGGGTSFDAAEAILYAAMMGIPITNNSWGGNEYAQVIVDAITVADQHGMLFVAAAGNDASNNDELGSFPASYNIPNIVSVAATDHNDRLAEFSNFGKYSVDLGAPGVDIYSTWTGVAGLPYTWLSGTSMATPMVTGSAALIRSRFPNATALAMKALLLSSVDQVEALKGVTISGGRLNVNRAVRCSNQPVLSVEEPFNGFAVEAGQPVDILIYAGNCADANGVTVAVTVGGEPVELTARGDGLFQGTYTPVVTGPLDVRASAAVEGHRVTISTLGRAVANYRIRNVAFDWVNTRIENGTQVLIWGDDDAATLDLPFAFTYFDDSYTTLQVSTNGFLVFGGGQATSFLNVPLPNRSSPNGVVAPFWDDFNPGTSGTIWYRWTGDAPNRRFTVAWLDMPHYNAIGAASFQATLDESSGAITFQYDNIDFGDPSLDYGESATSGIEHPAGTVGRDFSYNDDTLRKYERSRSVQFYQAEPGSPEILDFELNQATVAQPFSQALQVVGGVEPYTWEVSSGSLPPGLALDPATGTISGTPTLAGSWDFTVRVTDSSEPARSAEQLLTLEVVVGYELSEVPFNWIDARDGGLDAGFSADDSSILLELPFVFGFYDGEFSAVTVSSNGYVVFGDSPASAFLNAPIPSEGAPNGFAAAFWDDLSPQDGGGVWYRTVGDAPQRKFVIAWYDTPRYKLNGAATFEIILEEGTNAIEFHYLDTSFEFSVFDYGAAATIGVESPSGTSGTQFSFDEAVLQPYDSTTGLRFTPLNLGGPAPFITSSPPLEASIGQLYAYQPMAHGALPLTWSLLQAPAGMTTDAATGSIEWTPVEPGNYDVALQVSDVNGTDVQEWTIVAKPSGQVTVQEEVADGWLNPPGGLLSDLQKLEPVQSSDDTRLELPVGTAVGFGFVNAVPAGASIVSATIVVEYHEVPGIEADVVTWSVGTGSLDAPAILATIVPENVAGPASEKAVEWDVSDWVTSADITDALVFSIANGAAEQTVQIDHAYIVITYQEP